MVTIVLPPQDHLAQHHYWHQKANSGALSIATPPRSRRYQRHNNDGSVDPELVKNFVSNSSSGRPSAVSSSVHVLSRSSSGFVFPATDSADFISIPRPSSACGQYHVLKSFDREYGSDSVVSQRGKLQSGSQDGKGKGGSKTSYKGNFVAKALDNVNVREQTSPDRGTGKPLKEKNGFRKKPVGGVQSKSTGPSPKRRSEGPSPPKITILQRPQTKEAAMLDISKLTGVSLQEVYARNGIILPKTDDSDKSKAAECDSTVSKVGTKSLPSDKKAENADHGKKSVAHRPVVGGISQELKNSKRSSVIEPKVSEEVFAGGNDPISGDLLISSPFLSEKWAGPAFTNSPPPSSLPIPKFQLQRQKTAPVADSEEQYELGMASLSVPSSPGRNSAVPFVDAATATKDLRRILNLDFN